MVKVLLPNLTDYKEQTVLGQKGERKHGAMYVCYPCKPYRAPLT